MIINDSIRTYNKQKSLKRVTNLTLKPEYPNRIPLRKSGRYQNLNSAEDLMPRFVIQGKKFVLDTPRMAAVPLSTLKKKSLA